MAAPLLLVTRGLRFVESSLFLAVLWDLHLEPLERAPADVGGGGILAVRTAAHGLIPVGLPIAQELRRDPSERPWSKVQ